MKAMFPSARLHVCLEHAKRQCARRAGGGCKHVVSTMLDISAFLPGPAFHCYWERALSKLRAAGQAGLVEYLVERGGVGSLTLDEGAWTAKWQSSYDHVEPGCSTYAPNVIES